MDERKRKTLEGKGWTVGNHQAFLDLTEDEVTLIEIKLSLAAGLRRLRMEERLTQEEDNCQVGIPIREMIVMMGRLV